MRKSSFTSVPAKASEITPEWLYLSRRKFMKLAATMGIAAALAACMPVQPSSVPTQQGNNSPDSPTPLPDTPNTYEQITQYNNYYEFDMEKETIADLAKDFPTSPWQVQVYGLVNKPKTYAMEDLLKFPQEDRTYRLRCVEGWSMVIPWTGFPLSLLLNEVEPTGDAKFVRFETIFAPDKMPGQKSATFFSWPYQEGLRLDEAMHNLTILATGLYGKPLPPQDGAPLRLVVPWKYGFKSIKAIVKIELVQEQPATFWSTTSPDEYGFYANVNPRVPHPRWSQASERRIGELNRRPTLLFNGYSEVASLYIGMDLKTNF